MILSIYLLLIMDFFYDDFLYLDTYETKNFEINNNRKAYKYNLDLISDNKFKKRIIKNRLSAEKSRKKKMLKLEKLNELEVIMTNISEQLNSLEKLVNNFEKMIELYK